MSSTTSNCQRISLGHALGLKPLDRLQLNSVSEIREMNLGRRMGQSHSLPFMYFQRVCSDGCLELSSPGGYLTKVAPEEVCDIIPGQPIVVQAMPIRVFKDRLKLSLAERQQAPGAESYAPAYVLRVEKDRWGNVDRVFVDFLDPTLNEGNGVVPILDADRRRLNEVARRDVMPVVAAMRSPASYSADKGVERQERLTADVAQVMIKCAIKGYRAGVERLAAAALYKINRASLNKVYAEAVAAKNQGVTA